MGVTGVVCNPSVESVSASTPNNNVSTITVTLVSATTENCIVSISCSPANDFQNSSPPTTVPISSGQKSGSTSATLIPTYNGGATVTAGTKEATIPTANYP